MLSSSTMVALWRDKMKEEHILATSPHLPAAAHGSGTFRAWYTEQKKILFQAWDRCFAGSYLQVGKEKLL
jgi:hypothetical protein